MNTQTEEVHRGQGVWEGACHSNISTCSATWKLSQPGTLGIFMEASRHLHEQSLTSFPGPFHSQENAGWG